MRRRLLIIASSVLAISALISLLGHRGAQDPMISGKPLSRWLIAMYEHTGDSDANHQAIKSAGTNALPFLLEQIQQYRTPRWRSHVLALSNAVLPVKAASAIERSLNRSEGLAVACANVFSILGTNASPAIPRLVKLASQKGPVEKAQLALFALGGIGKETIPIFFNIITNQSLPHRAEAISMLCSGVTPSDSALLLPTMYSCLQDPDPDARLVAASSIQRITTHLLTNTPSQ